MFDPAALARARTGGGGGPMRLVRRLVVLAFALIQLILVARILLDLGILPSDGTIADLVVPWSDALAAPVAGLGDGLGSILGGGGIPGLGAAPGSGLNPVMIAALAGWTIVEALVVRVAGKFAAV
jgi:hypothetical protein